MDRYFIVAFFLFFSWTGNSQVKFESSNLPIIKIDTKSQTINDSVPIVGSLGIIYNGESIRNLVTDNCNNYFGNVKLKFRGTSSLELPKKSISIETQTSGGLDSSVSLLGMPVEEDWALIALYSDKTLIRDVLTFELYRKMDRYSPRARFCEVLINGDYRGVYFLVEKVKRDKNRVNISKLQLTDNFGDDVTGGYIIKVDKAEKGEFTWESLPYFCTNYSPVFNFQLHYPKADEITLQQKQYIQSHLSKFEEALAGPDFRDAVLGYRPYIDILSFIDYMLISELSKDADRYKYSVYMFKDKNSKGGKLNMGPIWDSNLSYGNAETTSDSIFLTRNWCYPVCHRMFWFRRLLEDASFSKNFNYRWNNLRKSVITEAKITGIIDSLSSILNEAQVRNFQKWNILGKYVWPNQFVGQTYTEEVNYLKSWVINRVGWMDKQLPDTIKTEVFELPNRSSMAFSIYPIPFSDQLFVDFSQTYYNDNISLSFYSITGLKIVEIQNCHIKDLDPINLTSLYPELTELQSGIYLIQVRKEGKLVGVSKVIKQ